MKKSILFVEDDIKVRTGLVKIAAQVDPEIIAFEADSEIEALKILSENKIYALFLDIQLLNSSGFDLAYQIRKIDEYKFTPIIFITGQYDNRLEAYINLYCYDYIMKPFKTIEVKRVIEEVVYFGLIPSQVNNVIKLKEKGISYRIFERDIVYMEYINKCLIIKTNDEKYNFMYYSLKKILTLLSSEFMQVQKSYIVNKNHISRIDHSMSQIYLHNDSQSIPIGRKYKKNLERNDDIS